MKKKQTKIVNDFKLNSMRSDNFDRVDVTWALPMYQCSRIGWLALEGMCRQEMKADTEVKARKIEWELLVMEEDGKGCLPFGYDRVMKYQYRLQNIGCKRIKYFPLSERMTVMGKLKKMAGLARGKVFMIQHPHCYPQRYRLAETCDLMQEGATLCHSRKAVFINKDGDRNIRKFSRKYSADYGLRFDVAVRTDYLRNLDSKSKDNGWPFRGNNLNVVQNKEKNWIFGIGYLNGELEQLVPFYKMGCGVKVPQDVLMRLKVCGI